MAFAASLLSVLAKDAQAQERSGGPVKVELQPCEGVDVDTAQRLLDIELNARAHRDSEGSVTRLLVSCQPEGVLISAERAGMERVRALGQEEVTGEVGARILVLAAVELLREIDVAEDVEDLPETAEKSVRVERPAFRVLLGAEVLSFSLQAPLVGVDVSVEYVSVSPLYFHLEAGAAGNTRNLSTGEVRSRLLSAKLEAGARLVHGATGFGAGVGVRAGQGQIKGIPSVPNQPADTVRGAFFGPYLALLTDTRIGQTFTFKVGAELGVVTLPVVGEVVGEEDVALDGIWAGVGLSVGAAF